MTLGTVKVPTIDQLKEVAEDLGFSMSEADLAQHHETMHGYVAAYNIIDRMPDELPRGDLPAHARLPAVGEENKYSAWYVKTTVKGAARGKLKDKKIALKDNICLAGVPMMNGSSTLEGYVPDVDATVVTRILDAGGTIVGKAVCEHFCFSGGSHTSSSRPGAQPAPPRLLGRRHSSGSAALVGARRGRHGAGRRPGRLDPHAGLLLRHLRHEADARPRALHRHHADRAHDRPHRPDDRQRRRQRPAARGRWPAPTGSTRASMAASRRATPRRSARVRKGMRIAVVKEGFGWPKSMPSSTPWCARPPSGYKGLGATVEEVSIPMHLMGGAIWLPVAAEGATMQMMLGNGFGFNWQGLYVTSLLDFHSGWRTRADELLGHAEKHDAARPLHGQPPSRPLLRQGAKPGAPPARRLRRRAREL